MFYICDFLFKSCGYIGFKSLDLMDDFLIQLNYFSDFEDLEMMVVVFKVGCRIFEVLVMFVYSKYEVYFGKFVQIDDEIVVFIWESVEIIYYFVGMCWMGVDKDLVVDFELKVWGVLGLWVVDVFVMLSFVVGNINVFIMVIVENVVEIILGQVCIFDRSWIVV